jgi:hypothetical protein
MMFTDELQITIDKVLNCEERKQFVIVYSHKIYIFKDIFVLLFCCRKMF